MLHVLHVVLDHADDLVDQVAHHLYRGEAWAVTLATCGAVTLSVLRAQVVYPRWVISEENRN
jgi:hypothetical protein